MMRYSTAMTGRSHEMSSIGGLSRVYASWNPAEKTVNKRLSSLRQSYRTRLRTATPCSSLPNCHWARSYLIGGIEPKAKQCDDCRHDQRKYSARENSRTDGVEREVQNVLER